MRRGQKSSEAAVGFVVKSGWACAVLLADSMPSPRVVDSRRIELSDPATPEARQPYHAAFGTARSSGPDLSRLIADVERFGRQSVTNVIRTYQADGPALRGAGVVVGSTADPERIPNQHIRIHALEGRLFRGVVEEAAAQNNVVCSIWRERDLYALGSGVLNQPEHTLRNTLTTLGNTVPGPWRAEQKAAALAAWLVLAGCPPS